jgi:adenine deaminase
MGNELESGLIALASGKLALDVLGPSAKLAGKELKEYTAAGLARLHRLWSKAEQRRRELRLR